MQAKSKIRLMAGLTALCVSGLPFLWIFVEAHIAAKIIWTLLCLFDIYITLSTGKKLKDAGEVEFISKKGLIYMSIGLLGTSIILLLVLTIKSF